MANLDTYLLSLQHHYLKNKKGQLSAALMWYLLDLDFANSMHDGKGTTHATKPHPI